MCLTCHYLKRNDALAASTLLPLLSCARSNLQLDVGILQPLAQSSIALASAPQTFANGNALQILDVDPFTGLVFARTPQQTLGILYGTGDATKPGLFLPRGINGNLKR